MKNLILVLLAICSTTVWAGANVGERAPDFSLKGANGVVYKLSDFTKQKKIVVLEWFNEGCPYVRKHYNAGNMQRLQTETKAKGNVVWFTIASSAKGKQGYVDNAAQAMELVKSKGIASTAFLLDPGSQTARAYEAKTTPHMFVIDAKGLIAYNGAIDSDDTARPMKLEDYKKNSAVKKYVENAVADLEAGREPKVSSTEPYGCSVKY